jgi:preflagellin peptidase FlaK
MRWVEYLLLGVLLFLCVYFSVTDLRYGKVKNKALLIILCPTVVLVAIYYIFFTPALFTLYAFNVLILIAIAIVLFIFHIWAGGDSKLLILLALVFPARFYVEWNGFNKTLAFIPLASFVFGYLYLLIDSVYCLAKQKKHLTGKQLIKGLLGFLQQFGTCILAVAIVNQALFWIVPSFVTKHTWILFGVSLTVALLMRSFKWIRSVYTLIALAVISIALSIISRHLIISFGNYWVYLITLVAVSLRLFMGAYNYSEIKTADVRPNMILSASTTLQFRTSKVIGLPGVSSEDLRSRLTLSEAESIRRWETSKNGEATIVIVRKIPYVIFIALGTASYLIVRGVLR